MVTDFERLNALTHYLNERVKNLEFKSFNSINNEILDKLDSLQKRLNKLESICIEDHFEFNKIKKEANFEKYPVGSIWQECVSYSNEDKKVDTYVRKKDGWDYAGRHQLIVSLCKNNDR